MNGLSQSQKSHEGVEGTPYYGEVEIDKVEFFIAMIDIMLFGITQPEGIEKLYMN